MAAVSIGLEPAAPAAGAMSARAVFSVGRRRPARACCRAGRLAARKPSRGRLCYRRWRSRSAATMLVSRLTDFCARRSTSGASFTPLGFLPWIGARFRAEAHYQRSSSSSSIFRRSHGEPGLAATRSGRSPDAYCGVFRFLGGPELILADGDADNSLLSSKVISITSVGAGHGPPSRRGQHTHQLCVPIRDGELRT